MMEVIVCSDSHGLSSRLSDLEKKYPHADLFLHCGDLEDDCRLFSKWIFVRGNNDYFASEQDMPLERVVLADGHKIYMSHSHRFPYLHKEKAMVSRAKELECDIVLYGHTHVSHMEMLDGVAVVNPGSIWYPRDGKAPSYARLEISPEHVHAKIIFLDK